MTGSERRAHAIGWMLWLGVCGLGGCTQLRLPAIDQSGERILLPPPAYTTLAAPPCCPARLPWWPEPAFAAPPPVPPCPSPGAPAGGPAPPARPAAGVPALPPQPGREGSLAIAPARVVAPVGSEVVLTTGFCGSDGYYLTGQPIEWMLSQDSVGHFVEVGGDGCHCVARLMRRPPGKVSGDYALARTSARAQVITRGTPTPTDDILLARGQAWISVTSPVEGASRVTALAPDAASWDQRRRTATIHWVDAQWVLPPPAIVRAGQKHILTTTVTRASGAPPTPPWLVRYELVSGAAAAFGAGGQTAVEVATDTQGRASVELLPQPGQAGSAQIRVQIIRTPLSSGDPPRTVIGEGWTTVTWSAPGLAVTMSGPQSAGVGEPIAYRIEVANPGDLPTPGVAVSMTLPPGIRYLNSTPAGQVFGDRIQWPLGDLAAKETRVIDVRCQSQRAGDVRMRVEAQSAELRAEGGAATRFLAPALAIKIEGPDAKPVAVGQQAQFRIEIANVGDEKLTNVTVTDRFDPGLQHAEGQVSPIVRTLGDLAPGATARLAVTFVVRQPGRHCHTLEATSDSGQRASARACLDAVAGPTKSDLQVSKTGPASRRTGEIAQYYIVVANSGDAPLTNVRIADQYADSLEPKRASPGFQIVQGQLVWTVERLAPGEQQARQVNCLCVKPDPAARNRVTVTADQNVTRSAEAVTEIAAGGAVEEPPAPEEAPGAKPRGALPPPSGPLKVEVAQTDNPIRVGAKTTYIIVIENDRDVSDKNVTLTIRIPEGLRYEKFISAIPDKVQLKDNGRTVAAPPVAELRPKEKLAPFRLEVTGVTPGKHQLRVEVASLRLDTPIQTDMETTVLAE